MSDVDEFTGNDRKKVYPVSETFKEEMDKEKRSHESKQPVTDAHQLIDIAYEYLGEWEHDPSIQDDAGFKVNVAGAAEVIKDFILYTLHRSTDDDA